MKFLVLSILLSASSTGHCLNGVKHDSNYIKSLIQVEAIRQGVDPRLAEGLATVESSLNPEARGALGEIGLFQVLPSNYHVLQLERLVHSPYAQIQEGIRQIKYWQTYCPVKEAYTFVICYNGGFRHPKYPLLHPYYLLVMAAMR